MRSPGMFTYLLLSIFLFSHSAGLSQIKMIASEFIFDKAPFKSCHASTLVKTPDGEIVCAWFGGKEESDTGVAIWSARRKNNQWSSPKIIIKEPDASMYNPVLFYTDDHNLSLYYKYGLSPMTWSAAFMTSKDDGITWSSPNYLPAGLFGPIRAKPILLSDGTVLAGSSIESFKTWTAWIDQSKDQGKTWAMHIPIEIYPSIYTQSSSEKNKPKGIIQPSLVDLGNQHIKMYCRSTMHIGKIVTADSYDNGKVWTKATTINLPNPNSGIDALVLKDHRILMVYNHTNSGRTPLNLAIGDDGNHFEKIYTLESTPGEYSYPAMIIDGDGVVHISYTWNRIKIKYCRLRIE